MPQDTDNYAMGSQEDLNSDGFYRCLLDNMSEGVYFVDTQSKDHLLEQGG